ncbi:hypothetical protein PDE_02364 [Penicillium oxalicum 114-2]|uniref:USP domain-containing protein n=1 Tax=Penicillium oxalicum (strain 114-2 / CGMCC 5302) TaxID=933388 RepID=S7ZFJ7_PENO1|nr:hypothetical protein PDE_02364 [Penicillium oxalicum 114-2]
MTSKWSPDGTPTITITNGIPDPAEAYHWNLTRTTKGFANSDNLTCYRNVVLQMLFHMPIFLNWVEICVFSHVDTQNRCSNGPWLEDEELFGQCKVCLLSNLIAAFWNPKFSQKEFQEDIDIFWAVIMDDWTAKKVPSAQAQSQEDTAEFFDELITQLGRDVPKVHQILLEDIFAIKTSEFLTCASGCGHTNQTDNTTNQLNCSFVKADGKQPEALDAMIAANFNRTEVDRVCRVCDAKSLKFEQFLTKVPEVLLTEVNRISYNLSKGVFKTTKIAKGIEIPQELIFKKEWLDPSIGNARQDIKYELMAVEMHRGTATTQGHYTTAVKEVDGSWTYTDDIKITSYQTFETMAMQKTIHSQAHILTFRRLPLVPRGPDISLTTSLVHARYSDANFRVGMGRVNGTRGGSEREDSELQARHSATFTQRDPSISDDELAALAAQTVVPNGISQSVLNLATQLGMPNGTQLDTQVNGQVATQKPTWKNMHDTINAEEPAPSRWGRPANPPNGLEIDFEDRLRGILEIKFTDPNGEVHLLGYIKGMLWNGLKTLPPKAPVRKYMAQLKAQKAKQAAVEARTSRQNTVSPSSGIATRRRTSAYKTTRAARKTSVTEKKAEGIEKEGDKLNELTAGDSAKVSKKTTTKTKRRSRK